MGAAGRGGIPALALPLENGPWRLWRRGFIDVSSANLFHFPALCVKIYGTRTRKYVALLIEIYWAITDDRRLRNTHIYTRLIQILRKANVLSSYLSEESARQTFASHLCRGK